MFFPHRQIDFFSNITLIGFRRTPSILTILSGIDTHLTTVHTLCLLENFHVKKLTYEQHTYYILSVLVFRLGQR